MVHVVVQSSYVVGYYHAVVMVYGSALVTAVDVFNDDVVERMKVFQTQFYSRKNVPERIEQHSVLFLLVPFFSLSVAVIVEVYEL